MALDDTIKTLAGNTVRNHEKCAFSILYDRLSKSDQKALDDAIQRKLPISIIVKALRQEGHQSSNDTLRAHLKEQCRCIKK